MTQKIINLSDSDSVIHEDLRIEENEVLIIKNATLRFSPGAGIFCLGSIEAENSVFVAVDEKKGWKGIADIGKEHSIFSGCHFSGGRGRALSELKDYYISRYFEEIDNFEMTKLWRGHYVENGNEFYEDGTYGGALITLRSQIEDCTFKDCEVTRDGGAVLSTFYVTIDRCRFERCRAGGNGGAVSLRAFTGVSDCLFISCRARGEGGGVSISEEGLVNKCLFVKCIAHSGGGVFGHTTCTVFESLFRRCIATSLGGGIKGNMYARRLVFDRCVAREGGGASLADAPILRDSTFYRCKAYDGGGLQMLPSNIALVEECKFIRCHAYNKGGGVYVKKTTMRKCTWKQNTISSLKRDNFSVDHLYAYTYTSIEDAIFEGCNMELTSTPKYFNHSYFNNVSNISM